MQHRDLTAAVYEKAYEGKTGKIYPNSSSSKEENGDRYEKFIDDDIALVHNIDLL